MHAPENQAYEANGDVPANQPDRDAEQPEAKQGENRKSRGECFGILDSTFSFFSYLLILVGFVVPAWRNSEPLSLFFLVFGIFKQSVARTDPFIPVREQLAFSIIGIGYLVLLLFSVFLQCCSCVKSACAVKFVAGLEMVCGIFFYCCIHDYEIGDVTAVMSLAFASGLFTCFAVACSWAKRYEETGDDDHDLLTAYAVSWTKQWELAAAVLFTTAWLSTLIPASIPGWNKNSTTIWEISSQKKTTKVFSSIVIATFAGGGLTLLFGFLNYFFQERLEAFTKPCVWAFRLRGLYKFLFLVTGCSYIFAIYAFTSDLYKGIDKDTLEPGLALTFGWVTAALYGAALLVQVVLLFGHWLTAESHWDLLRYVFYVSELILIIAVFFVPIRRNLEPVSMFYNVFGFHPCNTSSGQYIQSIPKRMTAGVGISFLTVRLLLVITSNVVQSKVILPVAKIIAGVFLFVSGLVYLIVYNLTVTDMTMAMIVVMFAACCSVTGGAVEIKQDQTKIKQGDDAPGGRTGIGEKLYTYFSNWDTTIDVTAAVVLFISIALEITTIVLPGWKVGQSTRIVDISDHCHSMQAYSLLVLFGSFLFYGVAALLLLIVLCSNLEFDRKKKLRLCFKTFVLLGGLTFSFATAALSLDIGTGVDEGTWSLDTPFWVAVALSGFNSLGLLCILVLVVREDYCVTYKNFFLNFTNRV